MNRIFVLVTLLLQTISTSGLRVGGTLLFDNGDSVLSMAYSAANDLLAFGMWRGFATMDVSEESLGSRPRSYSYETPGRPPRITALEFNSDGHSLMVSTNTGGLRLYDPNIPEDFFDSDPDPDQCPDGYFHGYVDLGFTIMAWLLQQSRGRLNANKFSPDGSYMARVGWISSGDDGTLSIVEIHTVGSHAPAAVIWYAREGEEPLNGFRDVAWSPDSSMVLTTHPDGHVRSYALADYTVSSDAYGGGLLRNLQATLGRKFRTLDGPSNAVASWELLAHEGGANQLDFSPSGDQFFTGGADGFIRVWLYNHTGAPSAPLFEVYIGAAWNGVEYSVRKGSYDPAGTRIAVGTTNGTVHVYDAKTGSVVDEFIDHQHALIEAGRDIPQPFHISGLCWNADGTKLFSADEQGRAFYFNLEPHTSTPTPIPTSVPTTTPTPAHTHTHTATATPVNVNEAIIGSSNTSMVLGGSSNYTNTTSGNVEVGEPVVYTSTSVMFITGEEHVFMGTGAMRFQEGSTVLVEGNTTFSIPVAMSGSTVEVTAMLTFTTQAVMTGGTMTVAATAVVTFSGSAQLAAMIISGLGSSLYQGTGLMLSEGGQWNIEHAVTAPAVAARRTDISTIPTQGLCGAQHAAIDVASGTALLAYLNCSLVQTPSYVPSVYSSATSGAVTFAADSFLILDAVGDRSLPLYMASVSTATSGVNLEIISVTPTVPLSVAVAQYVNTGSCPFTFASTTLDGCPSDATCSVNGAVDSTDATLCTLTYSQVAASSDGLAYLGFLSLLVIPIAGCIGYYYYNKKKTVTMQDLAGHPYPAHPYPAPQGYQPPRFPPAPTPSGMAYPAPATYRV